MTKTTLLHRHLAPSIAKALAKAMFGAPVITDPLVDFLQDRLKGWGEARQAERQIGRLVDQCLAPLTPLFAAARDVSPEAVALALGDTVERHVDVRALVKGDLDRERVHENVMAARPLDDLKKKAYGEANVELYRRSLPLLLNELIDIAPELKGFEGVSTAETLSRLRHIKADVEDVKAGLVLVNSWLKRKDQRWRDYASNYCDFIDHQLNVIQLFGLNTDTAVKRQQLSTAFIPLTLTHDSADDQARGSGYVETILNRLSPERPRLLITGPAGSGKTTLMRWAAVEAAGVLTDPERMSKALQKKALATSDGKAMARGMAGRVATLGTLDFVVDVAASLIGSVSEISKKVGASWQLRVPFLIPLRDCKGGKLPPLCEFPAIGTRYKRTPPEGWVEAVIEAGCALILIDGIDEVPHGDRAEIRDELTSLCESFAGNYLLFTTRPGVVGDDWFADLDMMRAEVDPLTEHDRTALIEHWHEAAAEKLGRDDARATAAALIEKLRRSPEIAQLGTSPLLAASICALHYAQEGYLPKKQADLCKKLCELLIHQRDLERRIAAVQDDSDFGLLDYDHKERLVQALALEALRGGEPTLAAGVADGLIGDMLPGFDLRKQLAPGYVRRELVERAGVLREAYGGNVDFAHNTLRDFLAGQAFVHERNGPKELTRNASDQAWHRPIIFAAGAGSQDFADRLIRALIGRDSRMAKILAVLCDQAVTLLEPQLRLKAKGLLDDVLPPRSREEAALLAALGDAIVDRRLQRKAPKATARACARTLRLIGTEKAGEALRFYWDTDQQEIAEELAQVFNPLAVPFWQKQVQQRPEPGEPNLPESVAPGVKDLAPLAKLAGLRMLSLDGTTVADLAPLAGLAGLQELYLGNTPVADLAPLAGLAGLQELWLNRTQVADLAPLAKLAGLRMLSLDGTPVADLAPLAGLADLRELWLNDTQVADLAPLAGLAGLETLLLAGTAVADLAPLAWLAGLRVLWLDDTQFADLAPLAGLAGLQRLYLRSAQVADLAPLAGLAGLQELYLGNTTVADLAPLAGLAGLQVLSLDGTPVADLAPLAGLAGLQGLWLDGTPVADTSVLDHIEGLTIYR